MTTPNFHLLVTYKEAARILGVTYQHVASLVYKERLHAVKSRKHDARKRILLDEIMAYDRGRHPKGAQGCPAK